MGSWTWAFRMGTQRSQPWRGKDEELGNLPGVRIPNIWRPGARMHTKAHVSYVYTSKVRNQAYQLLNTICFILWLWKLCLHNSLEGQAPIQNPQTSGSSTWGHGGLSHRHLLHSRHLPGLRAICVDAPSHTCRSCPCVPHTCALLRRSTVLGTGPPGRQF